MTVQPINGANVWKQALRIEARMESSGDDFDDMELISWMTSSTSGNGIVHTSPDPGLICRIRDYRRW